MVKVPAPSIVPLVNAMFETEVLPSTSTEAPPIAPSPLKAAPADRW